MTHCVIFCLSTETLDDVIRREFCRPPDQGLLAVAGDPGVHFLYVVDPWRSVLAELWRRRRVPHTEQITVAGRPAWRVRPLRLRRSDPTDLAGVEKVYRRLDRRLRKLSEQSGSTTTGLVSYHPLVGGHCGHDWADTRVFVARDDWASAPRKRPYWAAYRDAYRRIAERCTSVFAVSDELAGRVAPGKGRTIPNGVDRSVWTTPDGPVERPAGAGPGPAYAVYSGSIEVRLDLDLVERIVATVGRLVLAGPVMTEELKERLRAMPGVELTGMLDQRTLASVVSGASVGVIPHQVTPMTAAMSPLKMFEYLAAGLPVVATDLPGSREANGLSPRVWLCGSADDWPAALSSALSTGRADPTERARVLDEVSWDARLRPLVQAVRAHAPERSVEPAPEH